MFSVDVRNISFDFQLEICECKGIKWEWVLLLCVAADSMAFALTVKLNRLYISQDLAAPISLSATQSSCKLKSQTQKHQMALSVM